MKPISEIVNDREACERIGKYLLGADASLTSATVRRGRVEMDFGPYEWLSIRLDGLINSHDGMSVPNPFAFVALMNELGYGPEGNTIQVPREMVDITVCSDSMRTLTNGKVTIVEPREPVELFDNGRGRDRIV